VSALADLPPDPGLGPHPAVRVLLLVATGVVGGVLSGLFGVGGGIVMVPLLIMLARLDQRRAAATSLTAIVPAAIAGSISYALAGQIDILVAVLVAAGGIGGSLLGARLLRSLPMGWLRWLFIVLLLVVAVRLFFEVPARAGVIELTPLSMPGLVILGVVMGVASGLFGIGGGIVVVPVLVALFGAGDLLAKGTSLLAIIPGAVTGTIANARVGLVDVVDGAIVGVAAAAASFLGVALASALSPQLSTLLFAALILAVTAQLIVRAIRDQPRTLPSAARTAR